jgi:hypothetical protein
MPANGVVLFLDDSYTGRSMTILGQQPSYHVSPYATMEFH